MCRLAAYLGPEVTLKRFLLDPSHNLIEQAAAPAEMLSARLNADGFGFGWYPPDRQPARYLNPMPIWSDINLPHLARSLSAGLWLAVVRSATRGFFSGPANTHPFCQDDILFGHNGFIENFDRSLRGRLRRALSLETEAGVQGNTDSEYLFALLRQHFADDDDLSLEGAIGTCFTWLAHRLSDERALLNILLSDGKRLYATRHALNDSCPTLYYTTDDEHFPDGAQLIASERLTDTGLWQAVPEHHLLILDPEAPPELIAL